MAAGLPAWLVVTVVAALGFTIGFSKGGFAAVGAVLTPLLSLVLSNVAQAVGILLPMLMVGDVFALYFYWREWDARLVLPLLPGAVVGVVAGTALLAYLPVNVMRWVLALFVLLLVAYKFVSATVSKLRYRPQRWHGPVIGGITGLASAMFNSAGPAYNSYLLLQGVPPLSFAATSALFFTLINLIKLPGYVLAGVIHPALLLTLWWVFPFIPVGLWAGRQLTTRLKPSAFEWVIVALLLASSVLLIWQSR